MRTGDWRAALCGGARCHRSAWHCPRWRRFHARHLHTPLPYLRVCPRRLFLIHPSRPPALTVSLVGSRGWPSAAPGQVQLCHPVSSTDAPAQAIPWKARGAAGPWRVTRAQWSTTNAAPRSPNVYSRGSSSSSTSQGLRVVSTCPSWGRHVLHS